MVKQLPDTGNRELLENRLHLLWRIRQVVVQPPADQGEERSRQVVGNDLGRHGEAPGVGGEDKLLRSAVAQTTVHHLGMRVDRHPADQSQIQQLLLLDMPEETQAGQESIGGLLSGREVLLMEQTEHPLELTRQYVLFVPELRVKGGAADVGPVKDLLHDDPVESLL